MEKIQYRTDNAKDGSRILIVEAGGREVPLHSRVNPAREGAAADAGFNPDRFDMLIVIGCGLGYYLKKLEDLADRYLGIVIIDIIENIREELLLNPSTRFLADRPGIKFISGKELPAVESELGRIIDFNIIKGVQVVEHPASVRIFRDYYGGVREAVKMVIDRGARNMATVKAFGGVFLRNSLNNLSNLNALKPVSSFNSSFKGETALIVSSAPSLEDHIGDIVRQRESFYIIAVDSALPVLHECGIVPDFSVSIDPQQRIFEHFLDTGDNSTVHIFSISSNPELVRRYGGVLSLNSHPVSQLLEELYPGMTGSIDSGTGSVAGDALNFCIMSGFENIGMVGFDFSFSNNVIYSRGTAYQKRYSCYFNNRIVTPEKLNADYIFRASGSFMLEGKYSRKSFSGYRDSLNGFIARTGRKGIYRVNRRGLEILNSPAVSLDQLSEMGRADDGSRQDKIKRILDDEKYLSETIDTDLVLQIFCDKKNMNEILHISFGRDAVETDAKKYLALVKQLKLKKTE